MNYVDERETCSEVIQGSIVAGCSTSIRKHINYAKKLKEKYPDDITNFIENKDGSVCFDYPAEWFQMPKPRKKVNLSEEERVRRSENMSKARSNKNA